MRIYWDSSALLEALHDQKLRAGLDPKKDTTRPHSLAEIFSTLTKGLSFRYPPDDAAKMIADLAEDLDFIELTKADALSAIKDAKRSGVRGARIHDFMHVYAARKCGATALMTLDTGGFHGIDHGLMIQSP
jgi:predicted nucleic acid-binding protein